MITGAQLRTIKHRVCRPVYQLDQPLINAAAEVADTPDIYKTIINPTTHQIYRYLSELVAAVMTVHSDKPLTQLRVLDWGGGKGYVTYFLEQKGIDTTCYETKSFAHQKIWNDFKLKVVTSDKPQLPFEDKAFDAIVGFGVLEHVPYDYEALLEVNRVLKDDGLFFCFNLPNKYGYSHKLAWWRGVRYHDRLYSSREARSLLKRAGFNTIGKPWRRQLLPKNSVHYSQPKLTEKIDLFMTNYTPLSLVATSLEFVARKQHTYTSVH